MRVQETMKILNLADLNKFKNNKNKRKNPINRRNLKDQETTTITKETSVRPDSAQEEITRTRMGKEETISVNSTGIMLMENKDNTNNKLEVVEVKESMVEKTIR